VDRLVLKPIFGSRSQYRFDIGCPVRRVFPRRLHHEVPSWVESGSLFHIRIGHDREKKQTLLIDPLLAPALLDSAKFYEAKQHWHITLFLLMPDHVHALLSFAPGEIMSEVIRNWKRFHTRKHSIVWQDGYFDHRVRNDERGEELAIKMDYIRRNPVAAGLCAKAEDWLWIIDPFRES
jgi:REP element-mobilizing transposase RayT